MPAHNPSKQTNSRKTPYEHETRHSIENDADEHENFREENSNDPDFVTRLKMKSSQNQINIT